MLGPHKSHRSVSDVHANRTGRTAQKRRCSQRAKHEKKRRKRGEGPAGPNRRTKRKKSARVGGKHETNIGTEQRVPHIRKNVSLRLLVRNRASSRVATRAMCNHNGWKPSFCRSARAEWQCAREERSLMDLPDDVLEKVFAHLGGWLNTVAQVCTRFAALAQAEVTWERNCERHVPGVVNVIGCKQRSQLPGGWRSMYKLLSRCPLQKRKRARYTELQCGQEVLAKRARGEEHGGHVNHVTFYKVSTQDLWGCDRAITEDTLLCSPTCTSHTSCKNTPLHAFRGFVSNFPTSNLEHQMSRTRCCWSLSCPWCSAGAAEATVCFGGRLLATLLPKNYQIQDGWYLVTVCRNGHVVGTYEECSSSSQANVPISADIAMNEQVACA